jgi:tetratricopeptide (TPR) repeat protein
MKKNLPKVLFKIKQPVFFTLAMSKISMMVRDTDEFAKYGVSLEDIDGLKALLQAYTEIPSDDELLGDQINKTGEKDARAVIVREEISGLMKKAENRYGKESAVYRKFGVSGTSRVNGWELGYKGRRALRVAEGHLDELAEVGVTASALGRLNEAITAFEQALEAQSDAFADRLIATEIRTEKANEIYLILIKHCDTGKEIWASRSAAKYNDYIIYGAHRKKAKKAPGLVA